MPRLILPTCSHLVIVIYEYLVTLKEEITLFWMRKWTLATAIFFLNRYLVLLNNVMSIVGIVPWPDQVRHHLFKNLTASLTYIPHIEVLIVAHTSIG